MQKLNGPGKLWLYPPKGDPVLFEQVTIFELPNRANDMNLLFKFNEKAGDGWQTCSTHGLPYVYVEKFKEA